MIKYYGYGATQKGDRDWYIFMDTEKPLSLMWLVPDYSTGTKLVVEIEENRPTVDKKFPDKVFCRKDKLKPYVDLVPYDTLLKGVLMGSQVALLIRKTFGVKPKC